MVFSPSRIIKKKRFNRRIRCRARALFFRYLKTNVFRQLFILKLFSFFMYMGLKIKLLCVFITGFSLRFTNNIFSDSYLSSVVWASYGSNSANRLKASYAEFYNVDNVSNNRCESIRFAIAQIGGRGNSINKSGRLVKSKDMGFIYLVYAAI